MQIHAIFNARTPFKLARKTILFLSCAALVSFYLIQQYSYTPLVAFGDDLPAILHFLFRYDQASNTVDKIDIVLSNRFLEHRLLATSLITLVVRFVLETVHLPTLALVGGFFWVSIALFYYKWLKESSLTSFWLFPILCLLLSSASYQAIYWPMVALQHFIVIFLSFLAFSFLSAGEKVTGKFLALAAFSGLICTLSYGNGFVVWPAGLVVLLLRREFRIAGIWTLIAASAIGFYFWRFSLQGAPSNDGVQTLLDNWLNESVSFLAGLGGAVHIEGDGPFFNDASKTAFSLRHPAIYIGLAAVLLFLWFFGKSVRQYDRRMLPILGCSIFVFLTFILIVVGRPSVNGDIEVFKSRYYPYSIIAISNIIFFTAVITRSMRLHRWFLYGGIVFGIGFWCVWQAKTFYKVFNHNNMLQAGFFNWQHSGRWIVYQESAFYEQYYNRFFHTVKSGSATSDFHPSTTSLSHAFQKKKWIRTGLPKISSLRVNRKKGSSMVHINIVNERTKPIRSYEEGYGVVMATRQDTFLLWSSVASPSVRDFFSKQQISRNGYRVEVTLDSRQLPKGEYSLHQFYYSGDKGVINKGVDSTIVL